MKCVIHPYRWCLSEGGICHYDERAIERFVFGPFGNPLVSIILTTEDHIRNCSMGQL
jgi:hypothetical protein